MMKALWMGPDLKLVETVLLSLHSRWPDAELIVTQSVLAAMELIEQNSFDAIFVYLQPDANEAFDYIRELRNSLDIPILAVSDEARELERVKALYLGCDGIITATNSPIEIQANIMAVLRRAQGSHPEVEGPIHVGILNIYPATHEVYISGRRLHFTPTEFRLIYALARQRGSVVTHDVLLRAIWGKGSNGNGNVLRKYIQRLRNKLRDNPYDLDLIVTVPSIGYRLLSTEPPPGPAETTTYEAEEEEPDLKQYC